tara:strand:- start:2768 stop:3385 length:618 start_codon:yes stop_codon:yes gene_type:complete
MSAEAQAMFADLLKNGDSEADENGICLVTGAPLTENHVTLACGHKFNYGAIYNELRLMREWSGRPYDTNYVGHREMRCPYCREITPGLLPFVPSIVEKRVSGVNAPQAFCIGQVPCQHVLLRGQRKGHACGKAGFKFNGKHVCPVHWKALNAVKPGDSAWTPEHERARKQYTCVGLRDLLKQHALPTSGTKKVLVSRLIDKKIPI